MVARVAVISILCLHAVLADVYLHNLRGSNNRLNERSANRRNANRMFDSQVCLWSLVVLHPFNATASQQSIIHIVDATTNLRHYVIIF